MKRRNVILVGLLLAWTAFLAVVVVFYPVGGDATSYYYGLSLMLAGQIPVIDHFALQPPGFFLPFYAVGKLLSPSWDAMRLLSLAFFIISTLLTTLIVYRSYGEKMAWLAFAVVGFSHFWFFWNTTIIHYSVTNVLLVAIFFVIHFRNPTWRTALIAGFMAGWLVDTRLTMGPVTLFFLYQMIRCYRDAHFAADWRAAAVKIVPYYVAGGFLGAAPGILLFLMDPGAAYLQLLGLRSSFAADTVFLGATVWDQIATVIDRRVGNIYSFFFWIDTTQKAQIGNALILLVAGLGVAALMLNPSEARARAWGDVKTDKVLRGSALTAFAIFISHALTIFPAPYYIQGVFPFLVVMAVAALHFGLRDLEVRFVRHAAIAAILVALIPYTAYFMAWTLGGGIIRRNEPSSGRPVSSAVVGCWLERYMPKNAKVLSYTSLPVAMAKLRMPDRWTYPPFQTAALGNQDVSAELAHKAHIMPRDEFLDLFRKQQLDAFVNDRAPEGDFINFDELNTAISTNYTMVATTGGPFPFDIYLPNTASTSGLSNLPTPPRLRVTIKRLREGSAMEIVQDATADLIDSMATFPRDLAIALARVTNASFDKRCGSYLDGDWGTTAEKGQ